MLLGEFPHFDEEGRAPTAVRGAKNTKRARASLFSMKGGSEVRSKEVSGSTRRVPLSMNVWAGNPDDAAYYALPMAHYLLDEVYRVGRQVDAPCERRGAHEQVDQPVGEEPLREAAVRAQHPRMVAAEPASEELLQLGGKQ